MSLGPGEVSGSGEAAGGAGAPGPVPVPEELEALPAGALLVEVLEDLPAEGVSGFDTVRLLAAAYRQACRDRAVFLKILVETGIRRPGSVDTVERLEAPGEFACEEARAGLVWSRTRALATYRFAVDVFVRLPVLGEAMLAGELDEPRARAFVDWTDGLSDAQAVQVCAGLVAEAPEMVVGELVDRIKRAAIAIDPAWAERRYRKAVRTRKVAGYRNPDGTANLGGYNQPVDRVAAASARIDTLARACKRAGDRRGINLIRSDLYLGMVDGAFEAMTDAQIIDHVLTHPYTDPGDTDPDAGDGNGGPGPADGDRGGGGGTGPGYGSLGAADGDRGGAGPGDGPNGGEAGDAGPGRGSGQPAAVRWAVPELRVRLSTLLGADEAPAQLPAWDYLPAWLARRLVGQMHSAQWRYVVCGADGHAVSGGLITARPRRPGGQARRDRRRGGIVEIAVTTTELTTLAADPGRYPSWAPVITGITLAHAAAPSPAAETQVAAAAGTRVAGARLRRWIEQRDRACVHPTCRAPAASTDQDHRIDYASGGATSADNLESACRHDHRIKHDGQWRIELDGDTTTIWTSPLGHRYPSRPPPIITPLPDPQPDNHDDPDGWLSYPQATCRCPDPCSCPDPILPPPPIRTPDPEPKPQPAPTPTYDPNDEPPF